MRPVSSPSSRRSFDFTLLATVQFQAEAPECRQEPTAQTGCSGFREAPSQKTASCPLAIGRVYETSLGEIDLHGNVQREAKTWNTP